MDEKPDNRLREQRGNFNADGAPGMPSSLRRAELKHFRVKVFKSGNSLALRLPKALGLKEGSEMILRELQGGYSLEPADAPKRKLDVAKFWGKAAGMVHVPEPRHDFEPRPSSLRSKP